MIGSSKTISELKSIDGGELGINPFTLSDFTVTKFTGGFDLLFMYESEKRGMYSFDLGENLVDVDSSSGSPKIESWNIMYNGKTNTFRGGRGHNLLKAAQYSRTSIEHEQNYIYMLSLDTSRMNLRQGHIDSNGYVYTLQFYRDCKTCNYVDLVTDGTWVSVLQQDYQTQKYEVNIFNGLLRSDSN